MRYVKAKWQERQQDLTYRIYITDGLWAITNKGTLTERYKDLLKKKPQKVDNRSGNEIAADVIQRLGLKVQK